jgi:hypothetical protein
MTDTPKPAIDMDALLAAIKQVEQGGPVPSYAFDDVLKRKIGQVIGQERTPGEFPKPRVIREG